MLIITMVLCTLVAVIITPLVKKVAFYIGAVDRPDSRKVHSGLMPRLGGIAIYIPFLIGILLMKPSNPYSFFIFLGSLVIIIIGVLDDILILSVKYKLLGQIIASVIVVIIGGLKIELINLPFGGYLDVHYFSIPLTIFWILAVTNAINLIDGLDGLAAGVSSIAIITIAGMAYIMGDSFVLSVGLIIFASTLGFLYYNFYPAKIFMGDTGALFLGYMISVISLLGFKNVIFVSFIVPIIILGVPLSDTFFAIVRRLINKKPISVADKFHLHHGLLRLGFTHKQSVLLIYAMAGFFGIVAVVFSSANLWGGFLLLAIVLFLVEIVAEKIGLVSKNYKPLLKIVKNFSLFLKRKRALK